MSERVKTIMFGTFLGWILVTALVCGAGFLVIRFANGNDGQGMLGVLLEAASPFVGVIGGVVGFMAGMKDKIHGPPASKGEIARGDQEGWPPPPSAP